MDGDQPLGDSPQASNASAPQRCPRCGTIAPLIYVHGHAQCTACGSNILDCCQGAACDPARERES
jgi:DNA-directed RNA polymerase subunit RPC12/RpoP